MIYGGDASETKCDDGLVHNSKCYKIHQDQVNWFTAVNNCLHNNASLAVFDDNIEPYFSRPILLQTGPLWVGLLKSWWIWPDAGHLFAFLLVFRHYGD